MGGLPCVTHGTDDLKKKLNTEHIPSEWHIFIRLNKMKKKKKKRSSLAR